MNSRVSHREYSTVNNPKMEIFIMDGVNYQAIEYENSGFIKRNERRSLGRQPDVIH